MLTNASVRKSRHAGYDNEPRPGNLRDDPALLPLAPEAYPAWAVSTAPTRRRCANWNATRLWKLFGMTEIK